MSRSPKSRVRSAFSRSGAVAAGTSSRMAIHSTSSARPSKGRGTKTSRILAGLALAPAFGLGDFRRLLTTCQLTEPGSDQLRARLVRIRLGRTGSAVGRRVHRAGEFGPDTLAESVLIRSPTCGERFDDGDAATVRRVDLRQPPVRDRFAAAVGDAYVNNLIAARVAHRPGDPHHPAGQGPCVSDRVADQLS